MSFWEHLKPVKRPPAATNVALEAEGRTVSLRWEDGADTRLTARSLRQFCPCAECVEEWSGRRTFDVESIPQTLAARAVTSVGNYALTFSFEDGHHTGIFHWEYLRELASKFPA